MEGRRGRQRSEKKSRDRKRLIEYNRREEIQSARKGRGKKGRQRRGEEARDQRRMVEDKGRRKGGRGTE